MLRYGISSLLLLGAVLIGIFYLKPAWDQFQQIRTETDHLRQLSAEFDDLIQNRDALIAKLNLVSKEDLHKLEALIPQSPQSLDYLIALQQLAQENGVSIAFTKADINPPASSASGAGRKSAAISSPTGQPEIPAAMASDAVGQTPRSRSPQMLNPNAQPIPRTTAIKDLPVGIDITGSYETLKTFTGHLEHFGRLTDIPTLNFTAQSGNSFTFSMSLITHYQ
ncbi:MAG: hypothetical protein HY007_03400 [Candidatus Sungbacteria bacterium]|nr:hypothetical protein [Candidatus Sungbacteria bacterium]